MSTPGATVDPRDLIVDVTGMSMSLPEVSVAVGTRQVRFILDQEHKRDLPIHLAAFFSKSVLSDAVFSYPRSMRVAVLMESPIDACYGRIDEVVRRFPFVFTHQRELISQGAPFLPLMFGTNWLGVRDAEATNHVMGASPEKSQLVSFIGSVDHPDTGAYRFRREVAELAIGRGDVECYGKGIRPVAGKRDAIASFQFSIAMENGSFDHYFSEKLIDCLLLETVPVYYGCPGIGEIFDSRGLLQFHSREELAAVLDSLSPELYARMRPYVLANKQKAITERWHNHAGMFARLAESLPAAVLSGTPRRYGSGSRIARAWRRYGFPGA